MLTQGQASIDYLRYLEKCIVDLKAANNSLSTPLVQPQAPPARSHMSSLDHNDEGEDEDDDDIEMENTDSMATSPVFASAQSSESLSCTSPQSITPSPALDALSQYQTSSYASSVSTLPSPAFGPQRHHQSSLSLSASTSPTIVPSKEQDQEATAALLMLNKDRRNPKGARGMSVRDLLSS